jgi:biopolymer transport protein ExbB/TolQ
VDYLIAASSLNDFVGLLPSSFVHAGPIAKLVMAVLFFASVWTWILIAEGLYAIARLRVAIRRDAASGGQSKLIAPMIAAGHEAARLVIARESPGELRTRIVEAMSRRAQDILARAEGGLPNLAVIASVAPFIGLFGTVYGIMTSFANIAEAKDTSLAVVAPGIAEALAATAWGLAAAIPAVVAYNRLGAALARVGQKLGQRIDERAVEIVAAPQVKLVKEVA